MRADHEAFRATATIAAPHLHSRSDHQSLPHPSPRHFCQPPSRTAYRSHEHVGGSRPRMIGIVSRQTSRRLADAKFAVPNRIVRDVDPGCFQIRRQRTHRPVRFGHKPLTHRIYCVASQDRRDVAAYLRKHQAFARARAGRYVPLWPLILQIATQQLEQSYRHSKLLQYACANQEKVDAPSLLASNPAMSLNHKFNQKGIRTQFNLELTNSKLQK